MEELTAANASASPSTFWSDMTGPKTSSQESFTSSGRPADDSRGVGRLVALAAGEQLGSAPDGFVDPGLDTLGRVLADEGPTSVAASAGSPVTRASTAATIFGTSRS